MNGLYYHPPSSQPSSLSDLETALESIPPASMKNFILVGDFNINLLQPDPSYAIELTNITSSFDLSQVVNSPTRETDHSATVTDHVYTLDTRLINSCSILPPLDSSDHNSILTTLNLVPSSITPLRLKVRLYFRASFDAVSSDLVHAISSMDSQVDVNSAWNQFHNTFLSVLSNHFPNKILTTRKSLPWITYHLQLQLRKRDKAYNKAKRTNSTTDWAIYRRLRNKGVSLLRSTK